GRVALARAVQALAELLKGPDLLPLDPGRRARERPAPVPEQTAELRGLRGGRHLPTPLVEAATDRVGHEARGVREALQEPVPLGALPDEEEGPGQGDGDDERRRAGAERRDRGIPAAPAPGPDHAVHRPRLDRLALHPALQVPGEPERRAVAALGLLLQALEA